MTHVLLLVECSTLGNSY